MLAQSWLVGNHVPALRARFRSPGALGKINKSYYSVMLTFVLGWACSCLLSEGTDLLGSSSKSPPTVYVFGVLKNEVLKMTHAPHNFIFPVDARS